MWPFSKSSQRPKAWLTPEQAQQVTQIYYSSRDVGCWFACAVIPDEGSVRIATSTQEEAAALAQEIAQEVFAKSARRLQVRERP